MYRHEGWLLQLYVSKLFLNRNRIIALVLMTWSYSAHNLWHMTLYNYRYNNYFDHLHHKITKDLMQSHSSSTFYTLHSQFLKQLTITWPTSPLSIDAITQFKFSSNIHIHTCVTLM